MVDSHIVECELAERDTDCACNGGPSLDILKDVQRAYENRMEAIERTGGDEKLNRQVEVLRSWVSDLVAQNTLLARAVHQLEVEATSSVLERRRHAEKDKKKDRCDKANELKIMNDSLQKEMLVKEREIRRLNRDAIQREQTLLSLRNELKQKYRPLQEVQKKDAEVTVKTCCCSDADRVQVRRSPSHCCEQPLSVSECHQRMNNMELDLKAGQKSSVQVHSLGVANVELSQKVQELTQWCALLEINYTKEATKVKLRDDIIREMKKQLKQAKAKVEADTSEILNRPEKDMSGDHAFSPASVPYAAVSTARPRRPHRVCSKFTSAMDVVPHDDDGSSGFGCVDDTMSFKSN